MDNFAGHTARFSDTPNITVKGEDRKDQFDQFDAVLFHQIFPGEVDVFLRIYSIKWLCGVNFPEKTLGISQL